VSLVVPINGFSGPPAVSQEPRREARLIPLGTLSQADSCESARSGSESVEQPASRRGGAMRHRRRQQTARPETDALACALVVVRKSCAYA
jgi:hypothetical protein